MSSMIGKRLRISIFGQSHGAGIGVVIDGLPAGESINLDEVRAFLARRAPGGALATPRQESDEPEVLSGLYQGMTCGAPLCAVIKNTDTRSEDYAALEALPRPGHADYPAHVKYAGFQDGRGGGHFSGRLTAPLCFAGAVCKQILARRGVTVGAHIKNIMDAADTGFDPVTVSADELNQVGERDFPVLNSTAAERMRSIIKEAMSRRDSVGGSIECAAVGMPAGVGEPMFGGVENRLSAALFGIPAVKGISFGDGFAVAGMYGSENNDAYVMHDGAVKTQTNHCGGILGGITTGMPILFTVAIKPTPSIGMPQDTVRLSDGTPAKITVAGRHDPCIVPRAVPCVEAAAALVLLDMLLAAGK